ncbi:MAG: ERCC4 domain-containing protein [Gemmatimonadales bacterium]
MRPVWIVERTQHRRFPIRIAIEQDSRLILAVRAQSPWPGPGQQVFCLRERHNDPEEYREPLERVEVAHLAQVGRKLTVVLDRSSRKRCEFLVLRKERKGGGEPFEQVFFRTESGIRAHRSRARAELLPSAVPAISIAVDSGERYPWRFPQAAVVRRKLAVGDYAVLDGGREVAVVERKSFDNLLADIGSIQALHHQLEDLARLPAAALVIEAQYGDFLDERRLAGRWPAAHMARSLAELTALHPHLPVVFAGNRKLANAWCASFFAACATREASPQIELVREALAEYVVEPGVQGLEARVRAVALESEGAFTLREIASLVPEISIVRLRRVLDQLVEEGMLAHPGRGRGARWVRVPQPEPGAER